MKSSGRGIAGSTRATAASYDCRRAARPAFLTAQRHATLTPAEVGRHCIPESLHRSLKSAPRARSAGDSHCEMPVFVQTAACAVMHGLPMMCGMMRMLRRVAAPVAGLAAVVIVAGSSGFASDVLTEGVDNARTGWMRDEKIFTPANVGSTKLLWKLKLESTPRAMHNLFAPLVAERVTTAAGAARDGRRRRRLRRSLRDRRRHRQADLASQVRQHACQSGRHQRHALSRRPDGGADDGADGAGEVHGVRRVVGWPAAAGESRGRPGCRPAEKFIPGGGKPYALNLFNGVIYTATAQGCGGLTNAFYSFDLASRRASAFIPAGGGLWGRRGAAIDPEGRVFLGTGDASSIR